MSHDGCTVEGSASEAREPSRRLRWARRLLMAGCITMVLTAAAHMAGHLAGALLPANDTEKQLMDLVGTYQFEIIGTKRTYGQLVEGYSIYYSASLLFLALMGFPGIRWGRVEPRLIVAASAALAAASMFFAGIAYYCWVAPPLVLHIIAMVLFLGAFFCADVKRVRARTVNGE